MLAGKFVDKQSPPQNNSIGFSPHPSFHHLLSNLVWLRPTHIFQGDFHLFNSIHPNQIKQGSLGVCYIHATISSLSQNPQIIKQLFVFADLEVGFYVLRFYISGLPKYIAIDDLIPCNNITNLPIFAKPIGN